MEISAESDRVKRTREKLEKHFELQEQESKWKGRQVDRWSATKYSQRPDSICIEPSTRIQALRQKLLESNDRHH